MATASARPPEVQHSVSSGPIGTTTRPKVANSIELEADLTFVRVP